MCRRRRVGGEEAVVFPQVIEVKQEQGQVFRSHGLTRWSLLLELDPATVAACRDLSDEAVGLRIRGGSYFADQG